MRLPSPHSGRARVDAADASCPRVLDDAHVHPVSTRQSESQPSPPCVLLSSHASADRADAVAADVGGALVRERLHADARRVLPVGVGGDARRSCDQVSLASGVALAGARALRGGLHPHRKAGERGATRETAAGGQGQGLVLEDQRRVDIDGGLWADMRRVALGVEAHEPADDVDVAHVFASRKTSISPMLPMVPRQSRTSVAEAMIGTSGCRLPPVEVEGETALECAEEGAGGVERDELLGEGEVGRRLATPRHHALVADDAVHQLLVGDGDERHRAQVERVAHERPVVELHVENERDGAGGLVELGRRPHANVGDDCQLLERITN